jgi:EmrB/QacA subfamily drug resistance transporter
VENRSRKTVLTVLFIGVLMGALDIAIVGPALPSIRTYFNISDRALSWIFSIYVLFNLIGTPLMAKLSDQFGRRSIYVLDVTLFALGSLLVVLSPSFPFLLAGRAIQGFGAGGIFPVASAVIGDTFPADKRGGALGLIGAVFGLAFIIGPILGGVILSLATWQWLFLINLPIAVVVVILSLRVLPSKRMNTGKRFDWQGMAVLAIMLASLALAVNQLDTNRFFASLVSLKVLPFLAVFIVLLFVLIYLEKRAESPIISPKLFDRRQLRITYALSTGAGFAEAGLVFMPLLAVVSLASYGIKTNNASWMIMPVVLAMSVGSPLAGRFLDKLGSRIVILFGTALTMLGFIMLGLFSSSMALFILAGVLIGLGLSALLGAPLRYIMLNESTLAERSVAQGVVAVFSSTGQLLGAALTGAIAASRSATAGAAAGYSLAFFITGLLSLLLFGITFLLKNRASEQATVQHNEKTPATD